MEPWNHNIRYHPLLLRDLPSPCGLALDVGCGDGSFTRTLAARAERVVGLDPDGPSLERARAAGGATNVEWVQGDLLSADLPDGSFDAVTALMSLHHLPLADGLRRIVDLLRPGGRLAVLGLARTRAPVDAAYDAAGFVATRALSRRLGPQLEQQSPVLDPTESYGQVRRTVRSVLPGVTYRRHVLFRYTLAWEKPRTAT